LEVTKDAASVGLRYFVLPAFSGCGSAEAKRTAGTGLLSTCVIRDLAGATSTTLDLPPELAPSANSTRASDCPAAIRICLADSVDR
jgi:hypothetical protein